MPVAAEGKPAAPPGHRRICGIAVAAPFESSQPDVQDRASFMERRLAAAGHGAGAFRGLGDRKACPATVARGQEVREAGRSLIPAVDGLPELIGAIKLALYVSFLILLIC